MRSRRLFLLVITICVTSCWAFLQLGSDRNVAYAQQSTQADTGNPGVFHAETRLVLVDSVVTDKKGNYVKDLTQKDFKVWEDGKEQSVTSFSYEESAGSPTNARPHYLVLFFDNSTMDRGDQAQAREAAAKFIDANAGPDRLIAVAEFGGTVHISQNFTADVGRLEAGGDGDKEFHGFTQRRLLSYGGFDHVSFDRALADQCGSRLRRAQRASRFTKPRKKYV